MPVSSVKKPRPWYRPHASTWVVMVLALAAMAFWNAAGYYQSSGPERWLCGWPKTFLERNAIRYEMSGEPATSPNFGRRTEVHFQDSLTWRLWEGVVDFHLGGLLFNMFVAVGLIAGTGCVFEVWRRRRCRLFQIGLSELLTGVLVISIVLAWGRYAVHGTLEREKELQDLEQRTGIRFQVRRGTPEVAWQLLPGVRWKFGDFATEVTCNSDLLTLETVRMIRRFSNPKELDFYNAKVMPGALGELAACSRPTTIRLAALELDDERFGELATFWTVQSLDLELLKLTDENLRHVGKMTQLRKLRIDEGRGEGTALEGPGLSYLADLPHLDSLALDFGAGCSTPTSRCDLSGLGRFRRLRALSISNKRLARKEVERLGLLTKLEELHLGCCELEDSRDAARLIASHPRLKRLYLGINPPVPQSVWPAIAELRHLEELHVDPADAGDSEMQWIRGVRSLRVLTCGSERLSNEGIAQLALLPHLEHLRIDSRHVDDGVFDSLIAMRALRYVDLSCCGKLTPAGFARMYKERPDVQVEQFMCY